MFELKKLKTIVKSVLGALLAHRVLYAALSLCYASGCVVTEKPELYGPLAFIHGLLTLRG